MRLKMSGAIVLAAFLLLPASPLSAQTGPKADYQAGLAAYKRGEITAALKLIGSRPMPVTADSQFSLGLLYHRGQGVRKRVKEAVRWWRDAAGQGHVGAQVNLGIVFSKGVGVLQDYAESAKWNRMAAENGVAQAQLNLGLLYYRGEGVARDPAEAAKWYEKAAAGGNTQAKLNLGYLHAEGIGVPKDLVLAYKWTPLADAAGNKKAKVNLEKLTKRMSSAQLAEAKKKVKEWKQER